MVGVGGELDGLLGAAHQTLIGDRIDRAEAVHGRGLFLGPILDTVHRHVGVAGGSGGLVLLDAGLDDGQLSVHLFLGGVVIVDDRLGDGDLIRISGDAVALQLTDGVLERVLLHSTLHAVQLHGGVVAGTLGIAAVAQHRDALGIALHIIVNVRTGGTAGRLEGGEIEIEIALIVPHDGGIPITHIVGIVPTVCHAEGNTAKVGGLAIGIQHRHADAVVGGVVHGGAVGGGPHVAGGAGTAGAVFPVNDTVVVGGVAAVHGLNGLLAAAHNVGVVGDHRQGGGAAVSIAVVTAGGIQLGLGPLGKAVERHGFVLRIRRRKHGGTAEQAQQHTQSQGKG